MEETLESQLEEINAPGDHGLVGQCSHPLWSYSSSKQCMYMSEQVTWLRYLAPRFQEALWNNTMQGFMAGLYKSWFHEWLEEPNNVLRQKNVCPRLLYCDNMPIF